MSAIEYFMDNTNGMALVGSDLAETHKDEINDFIKDYGFKVKQLARERELSISKLTIFKINRLYIFKDLVCFHLIFIDKSGTDEIQYRDLGINKKIPLEKLVNDLQMEIGDVIWALSVPISILRGFKERIVDESAKIYIQSIKDTIQRKVPKLETVTSEIAKQIEAFERDYPKKVKTAFIIMQFSKTKAHNTIVKTIKETLLKFNIIGLRADDKEYSDELFSNIRTYMHCCTFGIAVFERILEENFNPNVSIEMGYMLGLNKKVCLLKDQTLKNLPSDLVGKLYKPFDPQDIESTLPSQIEKWLKDRDII